MSEARLLIGDVFDRIEDVDTDSIDLVMTSPPFLALRSYLPDDHPDKAKEIGQENTPGEYLDTMLRLVAACARPLTPWGSIAFEIGDTYSGSGGAGGDYNEGGLRDGQNKTNGSASKAKAWGVDPSSSVSQRGRQIRDGGTGGLGWPGGKSLCGIPTLFAWSLAYGRNLLTGEPSPAGRWLIRNVVIWYRPNPPVGDLGDKFRPSTSYLTIATRARDRYFDLDAVRTAPIKGGTHVVTNGRYAPSTEKGENDDRGDKGRSDFGANSLGTPPNDYWEPWPIERALWDWWENEVWKISAHGYRGSHYAVYPPALAVRPIKSMCPERVCVECDTPSTRIVESTRYARDGSVLDYDFTQGDRSRGLRQTNETDGGPQFSHVERVDKGWTDCGHDAWRAGHVLDPFGGSGTTAAVATGHGRDCTLIDLDERNANLCRERIGMFLSEIVEPLRDVPPRPVVDDDGNLMEAML